MKWKKINYPYAFIILFSFFFYSCNAQNTNQSNALELTETITLPGVSGRIDHLSFDSKNRIVFVAALGNNTVEAVDLKNKKIIHTIKNLHEPQGVVFIPGTNSLVVANGANGECDLFNTETFQKINSIPLGGDADNVRYDEAAKRIYVGYGDGGIAIIDAVNFKLISQIKLAGHPESFQINKSENKMYVNVPDVHLLEVIDLNKNAVVAQWKIMEARANFPMALDEVNHRLFIGCRHPAKLLVLDSETGKVISSVDIDGDTDDVFYNAANKEIYVSCGSGYVDVISQTNANNYKDNGKMQSRAGARTSLFIPELSSLIVAVPSSISGNAELMIYKTK